jgi:hypothetical protein
MKIHVIRTRATAEQMVEMLEVLETVIKVAVDVDRRLMAGGGEMHADCKAVLLEDGSRQEAIWGADWYPEDRKVVFESMINVRPRQGNRSLEVQDEGLRRTIEDVVRERMAS